MTAITHESDMLSRAVEEYLVARYPAADLTDLIDRDIQHHEGQLARTLYNWRSAANWVHPHLIGESRCVNCTKVMGDESSVCADETVCAKCGEDVPLTVENSEDSADDR